MSKSQNNSNYPLVSVIIPTYNRVDKLIVAVKSVIKQSYTNWELIIIDNNSEDKTSYEVNHLNNKKINLFIIDNKGVIGLSRNIGVSHAKGKYIAFLDSDDWWTIDKLYKSVNLLEKTGSSILYHNCIFVKSNKYKKSKCRILKNIPFDDLVTNGNTLITSSVVMDRNIFLNIGGFSESNSKIGWEDYHLWLRLAYEKNKFIFLKSFHGYCQKGDDNFDNSIRVLYNLDNIKKYMSEELDINLKKIWWIYYTSGRANLANKYVKNTLSQFIIVIIRKSPFIYKLKSIYCILITIFNIINKFFNIKKNV